MKQLLPLLFTLTCFAPSAFPQGRSMPSREAISPRGSVASRADGTSRGSVSFRADDTALENAFHWAKSMALHYTRPSGDPVGPWYESALPPRDAFCMRDVSHQCIGAEILGLHAENRNMFSKFTHHISDAKDWCTYWEIDKLDRPSPADYRSDREFWYNLNANFDLMDACWRSYCWTGDPYYLKDSSFLNFYDRSAHDYITRWTLQPDSLLIRPAYPNAPVPFNIEDNFDRCRGLPSYSEGVRDLKMGIDLVAALYRGLNSYAAILYANGHPGPAAHFIEKAKAYQQHIDAYWWDKETGLYNTYYSNQQQFGKTEGETFLLWFDVLQDPERKQRTIAHLQSMDLNVENLSYLPLQYYRNGSWPHAHDLILHLADPSTQRREYPEVSFGLIEAITQGLMGVEANANSRTVSTRYRSANNEKASLTQLPVLNTTISLTHSGPTRSAITNTGKCPFKWRAEFAGAHEDALVNNTSKRKLVQENDRWGQPVSWLEIMVAPGQHITVSCSSPSAYTSYNTH